MANQTLPLILSTRAVGHLCGLKCVKTAPCSRSVLPSSMTSLPCTQTDISVVIKVNRPRSASANLVQLETGFRKHQRLRFRRYIQRFEHGGEQTLFAIASSLISPAAVSRQTPPRDRWVKRLPYSIGRPSTPAARAVDDTAAPTRRTTQPCTVCGLKS